MADSPIPCTSPGNPPNVFAFGVGFVAYVAYHGIARRASSLVLSRLCDAVEPASQG